MARWKVQMHQTGGDRWCLALLTIGGALHVGCSPCSPTPFASADGAGYQSVVLAPASSQDRRISRTTSCPPLGDLDAGSTLSWVAKYPNDGDHCVSLLNVLPQSLSSLHFTKTSSGYSVVLPHGCSGVWDAEVVGLTPNPQLTGIALDARLLPSPLLFGRPCECGVYRLASMRRLFRGLHERAVTSVRNPELSAHLGICVQ
jgi:hypothetical protein